MKAIKYPKVLYVTQQEDGDDSFFLCGTPSELAEKGVAVPAAEYRFVREGVVIETNVRVKK